MWSAPHFSCWPAQVTRESLRLFLQTSSSTWVKATLSWFPLFHPLQIHILFKMLNSSRSQEAFIYIVITHTTCFLAFSHLKSQSEFMMVFYGHDERVLTHSWKWSFYILIFKLNWAVAIGHMMYPIDICTVLKLGRRYHPNRVLVKNRFSALIDLPFHYVLRGQR